MLATLSVIIQTQKAQLELSKTKIESAITQEIKYDFDTAVLTPLKEQQVLRAEEERKAAQIALEADLKATEERLKPYGTYANSYGWGQCTQYVASRIPVPNFLGNANTWDNNLSYLGWRTGAPRRGAIAVTNQGWWGHVAVVEQVSGNMVLISEMNYNYQTGVINYRWVNDWEFTYWF